jgi:hypothetical protein
VEVLHHYIHRTFLPVGTDTSAVFFATASDGVAGDTPKSCCFMARFFCAISPVWRLIFNSLLSTSCQTNRPARTIPVRRSVHQRTAGQIRVPLSDDSDACLVSICSQHLYKSVLRMAMFCRAQEALTRRLQPGKCKAKSSSHEGEHQDFGKRALSSWTKVESKEELNTFNLTIRAGQV